MFGAGPVLEVGEWSTEKQTGTFVKVGWGVGLDVNVGGNRGNASSLDAFRGGGAGACGGLYFGNACRTENASGKVTSVGASGGPSEALPVSGHSEASYTFITSERDRPPQTMPAVQPDQTRVAPPAPPPPQPIIRSRP